MSVEIIKSKIRARLGLETIIFTVSVDSIAQQFSKMRIV